MAADSGAGCRHGASGNGGKQDDPVLHPFHVHTSCLSRMQRLTLVSHPSGPACTSAARRGHRTPAKAMTEEGVAVWAEEVVEGHHFLGERRWSDDAFGFGEGQGV